MNGRIIPELTSYRNLDSYHANAEAAIPVMFSEGLFDAKVLSG